MIYSFDLEKRVLSGILQHPDRWGDVAYFLSDDDFYFEDSKVHVCIFRLLKSTRDVAEHIDEALLIERIKQLGISFPDDIDVPEYIMSLSFFKISEEAFLAAVRDLKKFTIRRHLLDSSEKLENFAYKSPPTLSYADFLEKADQIYHKGMQEFEKYGNSIVNLAEFMEEVVEDRGNNPPEQVGFMGPYKTINDIYGPLLRPGNISVVVARSGVGKTTLSLDYTTKVAMEHDVTVLHFDNGEMSEEELAFRQVAALSGVPMFLLESGKWRTTRYGEWSAEEVVKRVRDVWPKVKGLKFFYENVAGLTADEMCSRLKRFYFTEVGRGNQMIFSFDYIKQDFSNLGKGSEWAFVAKLVDKFKQTIHRELKFDGENVVSMFTSVQANRYGITTNRGQDAIVEDESVVSLSDAITQFCSHLFLLRKKTMEERLDHGEQFGTHKLVALKNRHLGRDIAGALEPVRNTEGAQVRNFINFEINNFRVEEKGDYRDIVRTQAGTNVEVAESEDAERIPESFS